MLGTKQIEMMKLTNLKKMCRTPEDPVAGDPCQETPKTHSHFRDTKTLPVRLPKILIVSALWQESDVLHT